MGTEYKTKLDQEVPRTIDKFDTNMLLPYLESRKAQERHRNNGNSIEDPFATVGRTE